MDKPKIVSLLPNLSQRGLTNYLSRILDPSSFEVVITPRGSTEEEICQLVKGSKVILQSPMGHRITRKILEAAEGVELIQFASVGYANIDMEAATVLNIPVANNPGWNSVSVAEHAIMMMLVLLRKAVYAHQGITQGKWLQRELAFGGRNLRELKDKTLGILGLGDIGTEVVKKASVFGPRIIYHKRNQLSEFDEDELRVEFRTFEQLLMESDILSVHVPLTESTRGMIGEEEFSKMKQGAILINTSRSEVVEEDTLAKSLRDGKLSGAGIDVPRSIDEVEELQKRFEGITNVILTPHIAGPTVEALHRSMLQWTENIRRALTGEKPLHLVNDV
jgi:lactate dehydrogenase-like 2-hydroxyacid dehydrogenase